MMMQEQGEISSRQVRHKTPNNLLTIRKNGLYIRYEHIALFGGGRRVPPRRR